MTNQIADIFYFSNKFKEFIIRVGSKTTRKEGGGLENNLKNNQGDKCCQNKRIEAWVDAVGSTRWNRENPSHEGGTIL